MDKNTLLKEFYKAQIVAQIEATNDIALLDLIHRLLTVEANKQ